jgi:hypothetical protein
MQGGTMNHFGCRIAASILASLATASSAQSAPFCDRLDQAMVETGSDDAEAENVQNILMGFGLAPPACSFSLDLSGSKSANCNWAFSYRSDEAKNEFLDMLVVLSSCADPAFVIEADQLVNHPDFYDLRLLRIDDGDVGLSIKDKVSLQQTYVFLRLTPAQ